MFSHHYDMDLEENVSKVIWVHYQEFDQFWPCCTSVNLIQNGFYRHPPHLLMLIHIFLCRHFIRLKKKKSYVSKLPHALKFFCLLNFFFQFFMNFLVKIYKKRYEKHNETLWTTDFFNSVFCLVSCWSKNQVPYFKAVTDSNLTSAAQEKKERKKKKNI